MRDTYLDSSKAILIFLVVFGHFLERLIGWVNPINHALLSMIYFIHMPAFIFVSGLLFKDKNWIKNIVFFISLYLPFQFLFSVFDGIWSGHFQLGWNVFERPYWILWYLIGMTVWSMLTHFLIKIKFSVYMAFLLALGVGLSPWNNYQYSIGRIFVFFPFFIIGSLYGQRIIQFIQQFEYALFVSFLIFLTLTCFIFYVDINQFWLYGSLSYSQLKVGFMHGVLIRVGCFIISSLGIFMIFSLTKIFNPRFIQLGKNTLAVYLLHGFIIIWIAQYLKLSLNIGLELIICLLLSVLSCWMLQQKFFDNVLRALSLWFVKPMDKFLKNIKF